MQAGLVYGHMGVVDFIVNKMKEEYKEKYAKSEKPIQVIATGGLATMVSRGAKSIDKVDRLLTLEGLQFIYEKNRNNFSRRSRESSESIELKALRI